MWNDLVFNDLQDTLYLDLLGSRVFIRLKRRHRRGIVGFSKALIVSLRLNRILQKFYFDKYTSYEL